MSDLRRSSFDGESVAVFRAAFDQVSTGRALTSYDGTLRRVNAKLCEMLGYAVEELTGRSYADITHPDDLAASREQVRRLVEGEADSFRLQKRYVRKDGSVVWVETTATLLRDPDGRPLCVAVEVLDVTDHRRSREELARSEARVRESEARARAMYERLPIPTFVWERRGGRFVLVDCNERASEMTGGGVRAWFGREAGEMYGDRPDILADLERAYAERTSFCREMEYRYRTSGAVRHLRVTYGHVEPEMVLVHTEDITEQRRSEEQLRVAQKMEAVAHLAGGLAHDFNNFMSVILGHAEFALERLREGDPLREDLAEIEKAGRRAAALTEQLLALGRRRAVRPAVLSLDEVLRDLEAMLARLLGEHVVVVRTSEPGLWRIRADRGEIEQVILNLAVNARDAMPDGGTLALDAANVALSADAAAALGGAPGSFVRLTVRDTGVGMDEATRARAFDPFFTTKDPGKGTGLGLATVYAIVRRSGGFLEMESEPGKGTTFRIFFPATSEAVESAPASAVPERSVSGSPATILLVEDDAAVRRVAERMLSSAGYRVLTATGGGDALLLAEQHEGPIDLLLADVLMPRMSGPKLAERLRQLRPSLRVLFMSGYAASDGDDTRWAGPEFPVPGTVLPKPIDRAVLLSRVREALEEPAPRRKEGTGGGRPSV